MGSVCVSAPTDGIALQWAVCRQEQTVQDTRSKSTRQRRAGEERYNRWEQQIARDGLRNRREGDSALRQAKECREAMERLSEGEHWIKWAELAYSGPR